MRTVKPPRTRAAALAALAVLPGLGAAAGLLLALFDPRPLTWLLAAWLAVLAVACALLARRAAAERGGGRLAAEHRMLKESVEHNPMPFAVYDDEDRLIAWNHAYEATHAETFRRLGGQIAAGELRYADLVRVTAEATLPPHEVEAHVAHRVRQQREADGVAIDRQYPGLGWLRVCKFATPSGAGAGFAVDINELKAREAALQAQIALSQDLTRRLRELADTDALTGTASRRAFFERAADELQRARRYGHPLCVAMLDIDRFKEVNDRHGHGAGDVVLARIAATCVAQLRAGVDVCGRLGGEEFAILLPETDLDGAQAYAERVCVAIRALRFDADLGSFQVSASVGVAALDGEDSFAALLARADGALYAAKAGGRDGVSLGARPRLS